MNTATHNVEVPFPQAFAEPKSYPFPSAPRYGYEPDSPDLPEIYQLRSNQTARCDECASTQIWIEFSRCYLVSRANLPFLLGSAKIIYHNSGICQGENRDETHEYLLNRNAERTVASTSRKGGASRCRTDSACYRCLPDMDRSGICPTRPYSQKEEPFIPCLERQGMNGSLLVRIAMLPAWHPQRSMLSQRCLCIARCTHHCRDHPAL